MKNRNNKIAQNKTIFFVQFDKIKKMQKMLDKLF